ncbi:serine/threonine protein kinase [Streptomyces sp. ISL-43]|uniref:serine/threonine-protein kinase n=1 Tax=Streptomyces sp. ISL-43 TaxID=2819183 RepID=UPI001BE91E21|nr:serine/threonine-protein kinase [Streptomyces sp. ISL-43]MBT2446196.1 serine/threonine protein kinase [Streptomyces sp. ISL-43]
MDDARDLAFRYVSMPEPEPARRAADPDTPGGIVGELLRRSARSVSGDPRDHANPAYFEADGWTYVVHQVLLFDASGDTFLPPDRKSERRVWICQEISGLPLEEPAFAGAAHCPEVVLDRTHVEAALTGLGDLVDFIEETFRRGQLYVPVDELLGLADTDRLPLAMAPAGRLDIPQPTERSSPAVGADFLLVGEPTADLTVTGLAYRAPESLLVACTEGVIELHPLTGAARWLFRLPGCTSSPLPQPDGSVFVICGAALVKWHNGALTPVAGPFELPAHLLEGPDGQPWVLSGSGVTFGTGQSTLALTRAGDDLSDQSHYPLSFDAAVRAAVSLGERRFLLVADGHSATTDLKRGTGVGLGEDWIPTPVPHPHHAFATGPDQVALASGDGSGTRVLVRSLNLLTGLTGGGIDLALGRLHGVAYDVAGSTFLLGTLSGSDPVRPRHALIRLTGLHQGGPVALSSARPEPTSAEQRYDAVGLAARGEKRDYRIDDKPRESGGQADVFYAVHKATGEPVAFKKRKNPGPRATRRWRRELDCARAMGSHPGAMPILDADALATWYVMPWAEATAEDRRAQLADPEELRAMVLSVASALAASHEHGWVHRDITPANILLYDGRWRLADWGIARRPRGQTSAGGPLTETGVVFGTEGYAAPELARDAHKEATPASDIYSLARVVAWILTGTRPQPNVVLLPPSRKISSPVRRS